jgi:hypothetical protein
MKEAEMSAAIELALIYLEDGAPLSARRVLHDALVHSSIPSPLASLLVDYDRSRSAVAAFLGKMPEGELHGDIELILKSYGTACPSARGSAFVAEEL